MNTLNDNIMLFKYLKIESLILIKCQYIRNWIEKMFEIIL